MPDKPFTSDLEALSFDYNIMVISMAAELKARDEATRDNSTQGFSFTRHEAYATARRAQAAARTLEMEIQGEKIH